MGRPEQPRENPREPNPDQLQDEILARLENSELADDEDKRGVLQTLLSNYAWLFWIRYSRSGLLEHAAYATDRGFLLHSHLPRTMHEDGKSMTLDDVFRALEGAPADVEAVKDDDF